MADSDRPDPYAHPPASPSTNPSGDPYVNPYAAPAHSDLAPRFDGSVPGYRPAETLVTLLTGALALYALLSLVGVVFAVMELQLLATWPDLDAAAADANDTRLRALGIAQMGLNLLNIVLFASFLYRSNQNGRALSTAHFTFTPGWVVGWFFIPFANLVKPYQAVREIWWRSAPDDGHDQSTGLLPWWWALWLVSGVLNQIVFRASSGTTTETSAEVFRMIDYLFIVAQVVDVVLCVVATMVVRGIHERQMRRALERGAAA
jgi:hypothetical protein